MRAHCSGGDDVPIRLRTAENHLLNPADVKGHVQLFVERQETVLSFFPPTVNTA